MNDFSLLAGIGEGIAKAGLSGPQLYLLARIAESPGTTFPEILRQNPAFSPASSSPDALLSRDYIRRGNDVIEHRNGRAYRTVALHPTSEGLEALRLVARGGKEALATP